jgi:hypothetical protein
LLCIGDAAHAMSPAGGVGINLAIQDAVATANILGRTLLAGRPVDELLPRVQCRREFPTRAVQFAQKNVHKLFASIFRNPGPAKAPWVLKAVVAIPGYQDVLGAFVGMGVRPEHVLPQKGSSGRLAIAAGAAAALVAWRCASACPALCKRK